MRRPAMNDVGRKARSNGDEDEQQQPVVGAATLGDGDDREPRERGLPRHLRSYERLDSRSQRVDEIAWQNAGNETEEGQREHRRQRKLIGFSCIVRDARSWPAEKRNPECLDEAGSRQSRGEGKQAADGGHQKLQ